MKVDYKKLGIHRDISLKVDHAKLEQIAMPNRRGIRADLVRLGIKETSDEPSYRDLLARNLDSVKKDFSCRTLVVKNLETIKKELSAWRIPMRSPRRWAFALAPVAGALCLCFVFIFSGMPKAELPAAPAAAESIASTDTRSTYVGSRNTETVNVRQLTRNGTVAEDFDTATAEPVAEPLAADSGVVVSVLPTEDLSEYFASAGDVTETVSEIITEPLSLTEQTIGEFGGEEVEEEVSEGDYEAEEEQAEESEESEEESGEEAESEEEAEEEPAEEEVEEEVEEEPEIVMADVSSQLNVRTEPSADAEIAGALYADSGAVVLEHVDGWTKIESGNLIGWASDDWLLTGEEALAKLEEEGHPVVMVDISSLNVRTDPSTDSDAIGHLAMGDEIEITETEDEEWAQIEFNGKTAYINTNYTTVKLAYNTGDTVDEMKQKAEEKAKAAAENAPRNTGTNEAELSVGDSYDGTASELEMLATIIYCEAGNQPYEGKVAVGNVVLNRMASPSFPNDMNSVIRAPRQFSPVGSGKYDRMLNSGKIPESCYEAAQDAMGGICFVGDCLYFKNPKIAGAHAGITIQDHVFW